MVAGIDTDRLYRIEEQQRVADALGVPLRVVPSPYGHDGFLVEVDAVGALVRELLAAPDQGGRRQARMIDSDPRPVAGDVDVEVEPVGEPVSAGDVAGHLLAGGVELVQLRVRGTRRC